MKHVDILHIVEYPNLDEFEIYCTERAPNDPRMSMTTNDESHVLPWPSVCTKCNLGRRMSSAEEAAT